VLHLVFWFTPHNCYIIIIDSLLRTVTSAPVVHSLFVLHPRTWFTILSCYYLIPHGSLNTPCYISVHGSVIHELCLWILVALSPLSSQSQIFVPRPFIHLIHSCLLVSYTLSHLATSGIVVHSYPVLHPSEWFTQSLCYIFTHDSLAVTATYNRMVHSSSMLHLKDWFTHFLCYIMLQGSLVQFDTSNRLVHSVTLLYLSDWFTLWMCYIVWVGSLLQCVISALSGSDIFTTSEIFIP